MPFTATTSPSTPNTTTTTTSATTSAVLTESTGLCQPVVLVRVVRYVLHRR